LPHRLPGGGAAAGTGEGPGRAGKVAGRGAAVRPGRGHAGRDGPGRDAPRQRPAHRPGAGGGPPQTAAGGGGGGRARLVGGRGRGGGMSLVVVFELRGELAHFRRPDTLGTHASYPFPTRTALRGLIAAVLGEEAWPEGGRAGLRLLGPVR